MPAAIVGTAFSTLVGGAVSAATATAVVSAVYTGAVVGAVVGGATAAVSGGNILKGAVKGAITGGVTAGALSAVGHATGILSAGTKAAVGEAGADVTEALAGVPAPTAAATEAMSAPPIGLVNTATETIASQTPKGIISKIGTFAKENPTQALILGQTVGGAAEGIISSRAQNKELEYAMERDKLNRESSQIKGLTNLNLSSSTPSAFGFKALPIYKYDRETGRMVKVS